MNVLVTLNPGVGVGVGPNLTVKSDVGTVIYNVTLIELLAGIELTFEDTATIIIIESLGICLSILYLYIESTTTTTTTIVSTTSTTTEVPTTSTTTTTTTTETPTTTTTTTVEITTTTSTTTIQIFTACEDFSPYFETTTTTTTIL